MQKNAFGKTEHPFMIKTFSKLGMEKNFLNLINTTYKKPTANTIPNIKDLETFPLRSGTR